MSAKSFTRSFAGGEVAPLLFGRLDLAKFQTGLSKCLNYIVTPQGPVENRPGFEYVNKAKGDTAVLIPFTYNSEQSFALEFGDQYIRFHTNGGTLLETGQNITGITQASPGEFTINAHGYAMGDWVFLAGIGGMTALNGRWGVISGVSANTFTLNDLFGNPINTNTLPAFTAGGTASRVYELASPYLEGNLRDLHYVQSADVLTIVHQDYQPQELRRLGATNWQLSVISFGPSISAPAAGSTALGGPGGGSPVEHHYVTTAVKEGTLEESVNSPDFADTQDLTVTGNFIDVGSATVGGAVRYNVYKLAGGVYGYIGQVAGTSALRDDNIEPDMSKTPPVSITVFAGDYPRAVSYFEQRRTFGGSAALPQTIWMTRSGTESNMTYSIPTRDDDAITAKIVAREANTVRHLVPLGELLALTSGGVWKVASSDGGAITPATISAKPQSYVGASNVQPIVTSDSVLYAEDRGSHIREVGYKWEAQSYVASDASVLAPHLFDYYSVLQLAYSRAPYQILWGVRDDGKLLGMTYQPEHEIKAWHQHDTPGSFKSVCVIPEGDEDGVYAAVEREINGQTVLYIERMHSRQFAALEDAFFVDCGLTYDGTEVSTITGLWHLEGEEVTVLADGGVHPTRTVTNGAIDLEEAAGVVHIGLAYNADLTTMPLALEAAAALGQGANKNVNKVHLRLYQSSGIQAGPNFDKLRNYPPRSTEDYGSPPGTVTGFQEIVLDPQWQQDGSICMRQSNPLPVTLLALTLEVAA